MVRSKKISIHKIGTTQQLADIATKPQPRSLFEAQREGIMQMDAKFRTAEELLLPAKHLRACEIIDGITRLEQVGGAVNNLKQNSLPDKKQIFS